MTNSLNQAHRSRSQRFLGVNAYLYTLKRKEPASAGSFLISVLVESTILDKIGTIQQMLAINFFAFDCVDEE